MTEYIERERLVKHYENCIDEVKNTNGIAEDYEICLKALKNQPAADVAEVRHGKWYYNEMHSDLGYHAYSCSLCKKEICIDEEDDKLNYCPHCGAKMDLGDEER